MRRDLLAVPSKDSQSAERGFEASAPIRHERRWKLSGTGFSLQVSVLASRLENPQAEACAASLVASPESLDAHQLHERIRERGHIVLRIVGGSMGPWFVPGDFIVVREVKPSKVRCGDVVVFQRGGLLIAHRVINALGAAPTGELRWKTKGDSAERCDPVVFERELIGRAAFVERAGRSFALQSPSWVAAGWLVALLSPSSRFWYPIAHVISRLCKARQ